MEPIELVPGAPYRITGTSDVGGVMAEGEFVGEFGSALIFRNVEEDPNEGFRTAWYVEWHELASAERGQWDFDKEGA